MNKTEHIPPENIHLTKPTQNTPLHTPHPPTKTGYDYTCHFNVILKLLIKKKKKKSNYGFYITLLWIYTGSENINTYNITFPIWPYLFLSVSFSFLHRPGHFSPLHLYSFAVLLVAVGTGPGSIEFQLKCKLGHFQFLVWRWDSNVRKKFNFCAFRPIA